MQAKTHALATTAVRLDLNVNSERTKDIKMDVKEISPCFYPDIISNDELQRRTSSSRKEDGDGSQAACCEFHQQPRPQSPINGLPTADEREATPRKPGGEP